MSAPLGGQADQLADWVRAHAQGCPRLLRLARAEAGIWVEQWHYYCDLCGATSPTFPVLTPAGGRDLFGD